MLQLQQQVPIFRILLLKLWVNELFNVFVPMVKGEGVCPHEGVFPHPGKGIFSRVFLALVLGVEWDMEWGFCF